MSILVTGGAGYIGAHVVRLLLEKHEEVVVVDNLSTGTRARVGRVPFVGLDIADSDSITELERIMLRYDVHAVIHFAAKKRVGESVQRPAWYAQQNIASLAHVLIAAERSGISRLVFSSSAAVYGNPAATTVLETTAAKPINPYGRSKLFGEWLVEDATRAWGLRGVNLRYFNVAGAGWEDLGDPAVMNLVTMVFARLDQNESPEVFGNDYDTPDGTCIRDYVHVLDLAKAHVAALNYLGQEERQYTTFNVGTGVGFSVLQVIDAIARVTGKALTPVITERRAGDPPALIADVARIRSLLDWHSTLGLEEMVESAWQSHLYTRAVTKA